jgi:hypothetical protein
LIARRAVTVRAMQNKIVSKSHVARAEISVFALGMDVSFKSMGNGSLP